MANIFVNGLNAKVGGGRSILNNYLALLKDELVKQHNYIVLTPSKNEYEQYETDNLSVLETPKWFEKSIIFPFIYSETLPKMLKKLDIDVVFNLADIPIRTEVKQVFLFDWSYAVYPNSIVWEQMDRRSWIVRKTKLFFFKYYMRYIDVMIAQTETMKTRLQNIYGFEKIQVIPNAVSLENMDDGEEYQFHLPDGIKLLYLSYYYPHKNLEIFIPLAKQIKRKGLSYKLITTIEAEQHKRAKEFLDNVKKFSLEDIIINIGPVEMKHVPFLYKQCDGLLMPTLLESFSGTYVEAMFHQIPIFTSDIDFASGVCKEGAFYFDPFDENSILESLNLAFENDEVRKERIENGQKVLNSLLNWEQAFDKYKSLIERTLKQIRKE